MKHKIWGHIPSPIIIPIWYINHKPFKGHLVFKDSSPGADVLLAIKILHDLRYQDRRKSGSRHSPKLTWNLQGSPLKSGQYSLKDLFSGTV